MSLVGLYSLPDYRMTSNLLLFSLWLLVPLAPHGSSPDDSLFTRVLADHVVDGRVNYTAIKQDERFGVYIDQLTNADPASFATHNDSLAFWINAYNAFTIKLVVDHYPVNSIREITKDGNGPWDIRWIRIHDSTYSLNDIENTIIRKVFDEPLIHMALVCAAISCPPLRSEAYTGATLSAQLRDNARHFFSDPLKNRYDAQANVLYLSEIFQWYGGDFTARYGSAQHFALGELGAPDVKPDRVSYLKYDWALNAQ